MKRLLTSAYLKCFMVGLSISFIEEGTIEARVVMALQIHNDTTNTIINAVV
mgnify:FL=1